jgi:hypothetical protein
MEELLPDNARRERVAAAGNRRSQDYTVARVADQFIQDFEAVIEESHGRARNR